MKKFIKLLFVKVRELYWRLLDILSPLEAAILLRLYPRSWLSKLASHVAPIISMKFSRRLSVQVRTSFDAISKPEKWWRSLLFAFFVVLVPQALLIFSDFELPWVAQLFHPSSTDPSWLPGIIQSAWQVLAAVLGISFVIAVFLFEFARDRDYEARVFPIFIEHSRLVLIITLGLVSILSMAFNSILVGNGVIEQSKLASIVAWNQLFFILNILFLLDLLLRTVSFLNPKRFRELALEQIRERSRHSIQAEARYRAEVIILSEEAKRRGFKEEFFRVEPITSWAIISLNVKDHETIFEVDDTNLRLLEIASRRSKKLQQEGEDKAVKVMAFPRTRVSRERSEIALVSSGSDRPQVTEFIRKAFKIRPVDEDERYLVDEDLLLNRDLIRDAIGRGRSTLVEGLLEQYLQLLRDFVSFMNQLGLTYTFESAQKDTGFYSDWAPVSKIQEHYLSVLPDAINSNNRDVIDSFTLFPYRTMVVALRYRDHLVFQRFVRLYVSLYRELNRQPIEERYLGLFLRRCWELPLGFYEYQIRPLLEKPDLSETEAEALGDYCLFILRIFSDLMKASLDAKDHNVFREVASAAVQIGGWIGQSPINSIEYADLGIPVAGSPEEQHKLKIIGEQLIRIRDTRRQAFLGLGGWLVHLLDTASIDAQDFRDLNIVLSQLFLNLSELQNTYISAIAQERVDRLFGWDWWELSERPEMGGEAVAQPMLFSRWMAKYYVFRALELTLKDSQASPELEPSMASQGVLDTILDTLSLFEESEPWKSMIISPDPEAYEAKKRSLIKTHENAADRQRQIEEDQLISQPLDEEIVAQFTRDVEAAWEKEATFRNLINQFGQYEERLGSEIPDGVYPVPIEQLDPLGAFSEESGVGYIDWGPSYGKALASREDTFLTMELSKLPDAEANVDVLDQEIYSQIQRLRDGGLQPVLLISGVEIRRALGESSYFVPSWRATTALPNINGVEGTYDDVLVVRISGIPKNEVVIVDLHKFARLVQYPPNDSGQFPIYISIQEVTEDRAKDLLARQPKLARDPATNDILEGNDALRWCQLRVLVEVYENVRFEDLDPAAGTRIVVQLEIEEPDE